MDKGGNVGYGGNLSTLICILYEVDWFIVIISLCIYLCLGLKPARNLPLLTWSLGDHATPPSSFLS